MMRTTLKVSMLAMVAMLLGIPTARADSPQFLYANAMIETNSGTLIVEFKETGLGLTSLDESVTLRIEAATAEYQCFNGGGKNPSASNKERVQSSLSLTQRFPASNGETTGRFFAGPVPRGSFSCPNGQDVYLVSVSYFAMRVIGSAGGFPVSPDPISATVKVFLP